MSLLNDISSEIIQPILPLFIGSVGGGSLAVGLIGGISDGLPSILKVLAGCWSDRLGKRKPLVVAGYALSAVGKIFLPIATAWQHVFLLKMDDGRRGRGFGLHRAMDSTGSVAGSLLAYRQIEPLWPVPTASQIPPGCRPFCIWQLQLHVLHTARPGPFLRG